MAQLPDRSGFMDTGVKLETSPVGSRGKIICTPNLVLFSIQVMTIFLIVCASLANLSIGTGNQQLWTLILTGSLGYLMPNPRLKLTDPKETNKRDSGSLTPTS